MLQDFRGIIFIKKIYHNDKEYWLKYFLKIKTTNYKKTKDLFVLVAENDKNSNIKGEGYGKV